ncbi:DSBA oxidoreductase [Thraustotheca clavata]|uniref:DSBA oxidoreductase n=1 Tax=Thraustotheca clavata TaxID=74557 RepID=A0A1V9ZSL5_9STRA|nr:DSBA oxidoreductase [Thraustotheca clavata]
MRPQATIYYDIISPFTHILLKTRGPIEQKLDLRPVPVFLPGLLRSQKNIGPAEIPSKREFSYASMVWRAEKLKIPFKFPPRHPFSSIAPMRLLTAIDPDMATIDKAFNFVFSDGRDPNEEWSAFCEAIGLPGSTPKPTDDAIKAKLTKNTEEAAALGIFGVPTIYFKERIFFGADSIDMLLDFIDQPNLFDEPAYKAALATENPLLRR